MHTFAVIAGLFAPIIGGAADDVDVAVVDITIAGGQCSGVVVTPTVVVTAAHCVTAGAGSVDVGGETIPIVATWVDRAYTGGVAHDLAALRLEHATTVAALPFGSAQLGAVRLVGFGATVAGGMRGVRHAVDTDITDVAADQLLAGTTDATTCIGDSGGAAIDPSGALVGVVSAGDDACTGPSQLSRPDRDADLARVIAAWSGPCPADGTCTMGCGDPDCDPCGFEGTCDPTCAVVDLDCPLGGGPGATCASALDCESRACLPAPEAADRGAFCTAACVTAADCPAPLDACSGGSCIYAAGTPGIAGAPCSADAACRSAVCDLVAGVCTVPCGDNDVCPRGLACEPVREQTACTLESGCASTGGGSALGAVVVVLMFVFRRRRD